MCRFSWLLQDEIGLSEVRRTFLRAAWLGEGGTGHSGRKEVTESTHQVNREQKEKSKMVLSS